MAEADHKCRSLSEEEGNARRRWQLLAQTLQRRKYVEKSPASVRSFETFGLFEVSHVNGSNDICNGNCEWYEYSNSEYKVSAMIRYAPRDINVNDLVGFNNTGNMCVWPSEEVLAYYCLKHTNMFRDKSICELGGGMTCLAGIMVALSSGAKDVLLTDGNETSVKNFTAIVAQNRLGFRYTAVKSKKLRWDEIGDVELLKGKFDYILCADCLFFQESASQLLHTIYTLLKPRGTAIAVAPARNGTFAKFSELAREMFVVSQDDCYDADVWDLHQKLQSTDNCTYKVDLHYPLMMTLKKPADEVYIDHLLS